MNEFIGKFMSDAASTMNILLIYVGYRVGLFRAMSEAGHSLTSEELASISGTNPRMVKEWLASQAANGIVEYDPGAKKFSLPEEHAMVLVNENSPAFLMGGPKSAVSFYQDEEKIETAMKTGKGLGWGDHNSIFYESQVELTKPIYINNLVQSWIPALDGVEEKLKRGGAKVAEIGFGGGYALIQMAKSYPNSSFMGYDFHRPSVERARRLAESQGVSTNLRFEVGDSAEYPYDDYDLIAFLGCLHDMKDPGKALSRAYDSLKKKNGTLMLAEASASTNLEENFTPMGKLLYSVSTVECVPASLNENGIALGLLSGESNLKELVSSVGFTTFRRVVETPLMNIYEAKATS
ncbi:MAG: class I SAM-dependent methyltransferase [Nitrososphaerales archaeon]